MVSLTQNNKIAIAAVLIFLVSFSVMLFSIDKEVASPEYIKANVLEVGAAEEGGHEVYFSENVEGKEKAEEVDFESLYREALGGFEGPIFALLPEGKVKFLSKNFGAWYGYALPDVEEKVFFSFVSPADLPDFAAEYTSVLQSGKSENGTGPYGFLNKDGTTSVVMVSFLPVVDEGGKVLEIIGSVKDITDRVESFNIGDSVPADDAAEDPRQGGAVPVEE